MCLLTDGDVMEDAAFNSNLLVHYHAQQLVPNSKYECCVRARSEGGLSDSSNSVEVRHGCASLLSKSVRYGHMEKAR